MTVKEMKEILERYKDEDKIVVYDHSIGDFRDLICQSLMWNKIILK